MCYSITLGNLKIRNFVLFVHVKHVANVTLLFIVYPADICQISWKYAQRLTLCKYQYFTFCSFTVLSKLKALQLSKVGLLTIKYEHSKNLTPRTDATWTKNTWKCICLHEFLHIRCSKCPLFAWTHPYILHCSTAVSIMSPGVCLCKWFLSLPR